MAVDETTRRKVLSASGNQCAHPHCEELILDLEHQTIIGQICHIKGSKPKAPRYDLTQSKLERDHYDNLIVLCPKHHKIIDDNPEQYPFELLLDWKQSHEHRVSNIEDKGWLGKKKTVIYVEPGKPHVGFEFWTNREGEDQLYTPIQYANHSALSEFNTLIGSLHSFLTAVSHLEHDNQMPYIQNKYQKLVKHYEKSGLVETLYKRLFELQDLTVLDLAVANTQGKYYTNVDSISEEGRKIRTERLENPKKIFF